MQPAPPGVPSPSLQPAGHAQDTSMPPELSRAIEIPVTFPSLSVTGAPTVPSVSQMCCPELASNIWFFIPPTTSISVPAAGESPEDAGSGSLEQPATKNTASAASQKVGVSDVIAVCLVCE